MSTVSSIIEANSDFVRFGLSFDEEFLSCIVEYFTAVTYIYDASVLLISQLTYMMHEKFRQLLINMLNFNNIKFIAEKKKVSLRSLATQIDKTPSGLLKSIDNESVRAKDLFNMAEVLGCDVYELVDLENPALENDLINEQAITRAEFVESISLNKETIKLLNKVVHDVYK
jgi:transcriptional regulator with XRE-family HTH domain